MSKRAYRGRPKAALVVEEPFRIVLAVDMEAYWVWLARFLPISEIYRLKTINSREKMQEFMQERGIDFTFE